MDNASNTATKVNALHFTEALADAQDDAGLEDMILNIFPDMDLRGAEYEEEEYRQDGGRYIDVKLNISIPNPDYPTTFLHTFILEEDEWLVEAPGTQYGYTVMSDRKYREFNKQ